MKPDQIAEITGSKLKMPGEKFPKGVPVIELSIEPGALPAPDHPATSQIKPDTTVHEAIRNLVNHAYMLGHYAGKNEVVDKMRDAGLGEYFE